MKGWAAPIPSRQGLLIRTGGKDLFLGDGEERGRRVPGSEGRGIVSRFREEDGILGGGSPVFKKLLGRMIANRVE